MNPIKKYFQLSYKEKTFLTTLASLLVTIAFAIYSGVLGVIAKSVWYGSICIYYLLIVVIKALILLVRHKDGSRVIPFIDFAILLIINISMIAPAAFLIKGEKSYDWGLIPAIAQAVYTTYSITLSIVNIVKSTKVDNIYVKQIRVTNIVSSLMSIIGIQNTLILSNNGMNESMKLLSIYTTFFLLLAAILITLISFIRYIRNLREQQLNQNKTNS